jgi:hypothetical protein
VHGPEEIVQVFYRLFVVGRVGNIDIQLYGSHGAASFVVTNVLEKMQIAKGGGQSAKFARSSHF